jgi:hypothetical protein
MQISNNYSDMYNYGVCRNLKLELRIHVFLYQFVKQIVFL